MIRLVIYMLGLLIVTSAVFMGALAFPSDIPFNLAAAVALLVLGLGVLGATYVVPDRFWVTREVAAPPLAPGEEVVEERRRRTY